MTKRRITSREQIELIAGAHGWFVVCPIWPPGQDRYERGDEWITIQFNASDNVKTALINGITVTGPNKFRQITSALMGDEFS